MKEKTRGWEGQQAVSKALLTGGQEPRRDKFSQTGSVVWHQQARPARAVKSLFKLLVLALSKNQAGLQIER
jgi:hypothetical protein